MRNLMATVGVILAAALAGPAAACDRQMPARAERMAVPTQGINQTLVSEAIRAEVNWHRCRAGRRALRAAGGRGVVIAAGHADWMAEARQLSHRSTRRGARSVKQRLRRTGRFQRAGSENISAVHRFAIDNRKFQIVDRSRCRFATVRGQVLPAHSYASLARHAVTLWMRSPGHRRNILDRRVTHIATGAAFGNSANCGKFWLAQNFVG